MKSPKRSISMNTLLPLRQFVTVLLASTLVSTQAAVLVLYDFTGYTAGSDAPYLSADTDPNSTAGGFSPGVGLGTNGNWNSTHNGIDDSQFGNPLPSFAQKARAAVTSQALSFSENAYFSFSITPSSGYEMDLTSLTFDVRTFNVVANSINFYLSSNIAGFSSPIGSVTTGYNTAGNFQTVSFDLSGASFQSLTSPTEFRLYLWWDALAGTGSGSAPRFDNVTLNGSVAPVPEPAGVLLCGLGLGLVLLRSRRCRM